MPANLRNVVYISIGSELLKGEVLNTNAAFLGRVLFEHGMKLIGERTVPDEEPAMHHAIEAALAQDAGWIVTSGGLGPTFDDVTRQVLSTYFGKPLEFSSYHYKELMKRISRHKIPSQSLQEGIRSQCFSLKAHESSSINWAALGDL
ncbi:MAG: hypothetical protein HY586_03295 [Candidatus Omnitrophica bacterium]|nr:hypothetical protein [Candidatus Omnitrophota bacterium]